MTAWYLLLGLAGVLVGSAAAKTVAAARGTLSWPKGPVLLWWEVPARAAIGLEIVAALVASMLPSALLAGALLAVSYGLLTVAAVTLRGRSCACFGAVGGRIGWLHVAVNAFAAGSAAVLGVLAAAGPPPPLWARPLAVAVVALAVTGWSVIAMRRHETTQSAQDDACLGDARSVLVLTMEGCPACRALRMVLEGSGSRAIRWHLVTDEDEPIARLAEGQYPCAVALDVGGEPTCPPRWGLADAKRLVDTFVDHDLRRVAR